MKYDSILDTIGGTPHIRLSRLFDARIEVWLKLERSNPGGSIKDRIALSMVEDAERRGVLTPGATIIEPTSGNTGVGLALVAAVRGYRLILVMPDSMSIERRRLMAAYGASFELTPRARGMQGAIERANQLLDEIPGAWLPNQFDNPANPGAHRRTTAEEIAADFPEGLDLIVGGVGTGGHVTAIGEVLKPRWPRLRVVAVEPASSPVLSGGAPGPHPIQGIGAGFVPGNYHGATVDAIETIDGDAAYGWARRLAREEGVLAGVSTGAALAAVATRAPGLPDGSRVLTFAYDTGERYLSVEGLFPDVAPAEPR